MILSLHGLCHKAYWVMMSQDIYDGKRREGTHVSILVKRVR